MSGSFQEMRRGTAGMKRFQLFDAFRLRDILLNFILGSVFLYFPLPVGKKNHFDIVFLEYQYCSY